MNRAARELAERRAARDLARDHFDTQVARAKVELAPSSVKQRLMADARHKSLELATEAIEIANDSRGVVIGTAAALVLWLARKPIGKAATELWQQAAEAGLAEKGIAAIKQVFGGMQFPGGRASKTMEDHDRA